MKRETTHLRHRQLGRRGAAMVEAAVVFGVFASILLSSLDLSLAVMHENTLAEAARRLARAAIVHGESSSAINTPWGPTTYSGTASDDSAYAAEIRGILVSINPADVAISLEWPDGGNKSGHRVQATVTSVYQPMVASLLGTTPYTLQGSSTMRIEH